MCILHTNVSTGKVNCIRDSSLKQQDVGWTANLKLKAWEGINVSTNSGRLWTPRSLLFYEQLVLVSVASFRWLKSTFRLRLVLTSMVLLLYAFIRCADVTVNILSMSPGVYRTSQQILTYFLHAAQSFLRSSLVFNWSRKSPHFMEPEGSLSHSQVPATCHYPLPARSSPYPHILLPEYPS